MDDRALTLPERLARARRALHQLGAQALLVPSADPHLSEYLPERWQGRQWLSGFTGSMGTLVVTTTRAVLLADSRYWEQAERELAGSGIALEKIPNGSSPQQLLLAWLTDTLPRGATLCVDGQVLGLSTAQALRQALDKAGIALRTEADWLDLRLDDDGQPLWPARPPLPAAPVHAPPAMDRPRAARLALVHEAMARHGARWHLVSTVDDVAWITALRGADVDYNPVFLAHLLIDACERRATLFVGAGKLSPALQAELAADGVTLADYAAAGPALAALAAGMPAADDQPGDPGTCSGHADHPSHTAANAPAEARPDTIADAIADTHASAPPDALLIDPKRITLGLRQCVPQALRVVEAPNPSVALKSRKTDAEVAALRRTMEHDGAAMCRFYARWEAALAQPPAAGLTELTVDEWLSAERARLPGFVGLSFPTIAGYNANGALPHYRALPDAHSAIDGQGLLLIDSGGQYRNGVDADGQPCGGTTDITRVWPIGTPSAAQRRDCTHVLQGMLALSRAVFPVGTPGPMLDALARAPLWQHGLDYGHGTGHGVGFYLNVHEGPQNISKAAWEPQMALHSGMVTSNEPGLYRSGQWGVRIENLLLTVPAETPEDGRFGPMLRFETLTLCPIDTRCLLPELLRADEIAWLNTYHAEVQRRLSPLLQAPEDAAALAWLQARTVALG